jgi:glycosyltransferase involved in cell wall biosynthesis
MKILHINPFYYPYRGGTENYLYELNRRLAKRHHVSVITSKLPGTPEFEIIGGARVHRVRSFVLTRLPPPLPPPFSLPIGFRKKLLEICRRERPDILHLHNRFFVNFAAVAFWKQRTKRPLFITLHNARTVGIGGATDFFGQVYDRVIGQRIIRRADWIIANSKWTLEITVPDDYPREKTEVIHNGVDTRKFRRVRTGIRDGMGCDYLITTVCRLVPQKGLAVLLRALHELEKDFIAVIIGRGPLLKSLKRLSRKLGINQRVRFLTNVLSEREMIQYYSASDVFVLPSLWEPFGIVLLEAMACGVPTIATRVGGIPEVLDGCGVLVEPGRPSALAEAIDRVLDDSRLRKKLSRAARARCVRMFDWEVIARRMERSYSRFLEGAVEG